MAAPSIDKERYSMQQGQTYAARQTRNTSVQQGQR